MRDFKFNQVFPSAEERQQRSGVLWGRVDPELDEDTGALCVSECVCVCARYLPSGTCTSL